MTARSGSTAIIVTMTTTKHIVVAINPTASFGASRAVGPAVVSTLRGLGYEVTSLTEPDFEQLRDAAAAALADKPDALVVVGGDGMVSLGTNLLAGTKIPLGIIPSGTGNDMARGLGIPVGNVEAAIGALVTALDRPPRVIDAVEVTNGDGETRWFASVLSAGFDAIVNERANLLRHPKGKNRYLLALALELLRLKPITYRIALDEVESVSRGMLVSAGNNVSIGGGMRVTPNAILNDGLLDVMVVGPLTRIGFLKLFPRVFKGTHITDPRVSIHRARHVRIEADGVVAYADGERVGPLPVDLLVRPGALRVLSAS
jgi:diacylglycerol kinase (ATP)